MKLKAVPRIRADCISCNGYSSVRMQEGIHRINTAEVTVFTRHLRSGGVKQYVNKTTSGMADAGLPRSGVVGVVMPQRKIFESMEAKDFLYGNEEFTLSVMW